MTEPAAPNAPKPPRKRAKPADAAPLLTLERDALLAALEGATQPIARRTTIPILAHVKVAAAGGTLTLTGTNLEQWLTTHCPTSSGELLTTLPSPPLLALVKALPSGAMIALGRDGERVTLRAGRARFALPTLPADDFPVTPDADLPVEFELPAQQLATLLEFVSHAIGTDESRYYLNGVCLRPATASGTAGLLIGEATDGHRLARRTLPADGAADLGRLIVPAAAVPILAKLTGAAGDRPVQVAASNSRIRFTFPGARPEAGGTVCETRLIDGTFPDTDRVIPQDPNSRVTADRDALTAMIARVAVVVEDGRALKLEAGDGELAVSAKDATGHAASDAIDVGHDGPAVEVGLAPRYLRQALAVCDEGTVTLEFGDPGAPVRITGADPEAALQVIMPMRV